MTTKTNAVCVNIQSSMILNCTRATLYHTDGQISHIMLAAPRYTRDFTEQEWAANFVRDYVKKLAKDYISINQFQIDLGKMDAHGNYESIEITYAMVVL